MGKISKFLHIFGLAPFLATTLILVWYAQFLSRKLRAHGSIVSYLSGVKTLHTLLNFSVKGFHGFLLKLTLRGLRRGEPTHNKKGQTNDASVTEDDLCKTESL